MIHVLYRDTSRPSGYGKTRPSWFSFERCLESMLSSIEGLDFITFHLIYDGYYESTDPRIHNVINFTGNSDWNSYVYAWNYAKNLDMKEDDLVFFAENDYVFIKNWPHKVQELFNMYSNIDYVTLYDHPHFYNQNDYPGLMAYMFPTKTHHWKTVPSSTGSIITNKKILDIDLDIHTTEASDRRRFEYLGNQRKRSILAPIPSLSTHCEVEWLAPAIDWETIIIKK